MFPTHIPSAPQAPKSVMTLREIDKESPANAHLMDRYNSGRNSIAIVATTEALSNIAVACTNNGFIQVIDMARGVYRLFVVDIAPKTYIDLPPRCLAIDPTPALVSATVGAENIGVKEIALVFAPAYSPSVSHASTVTGDVFDLINLRSRPSAISIDGDFAVAGDGSGEACAWRTGTYSLLWRASLCQDNTSSSIVNILQHRETCFFAMSNSTVIVCSVRTGTILSTLLGDSSPIAGIVPSVPFADAVVVATAAGSLTVWAPPLKNVVTKGVGSSTQATSLAAIPDQLAGQAWQILSVINTDMLIKTVALQSGFLAIGGSDGRVALFDASKIAVTNSKGKAKLPLLCCFDLEHPILKCGVARDNHFSIVTQVGDVWRWPIEQVLPSSTNPNMKRTSHHQVRRAKNNDIKGSGLEYNTDEVYQDDDDDVYDEVEGEKNDDEYYYEGQDAAVAADEEEQEEDDDDAAHQNSYYEEPPHQSENVPTPDTSRDDNNNNHINSNNTSSSSVAVANQQPPTSLPNPARRLSTDSSSHCQQRSATSSGGLPPLPRNNNNTTTTKNMSRNDDESLFQHEEEDLADSDIVLQHSGSKIGDIERVGGRHQGHDHDDDDDQSQVDSDFANSFLRNNNTHHHKNANKRRNNEGEDDDEDDLINTQQWAKQQEKHRDPLGDTQQPGLRFASSSGAQEWYESKNKNQQQQQQQQQETVILVDDDDEDGNGNDNDKANQHQMKRNTDKNTSNNKNIDEPAPSSQIPQPTPMQQQATPAHSSSTPSSRGSQLRPTPHSSSSGGGSSSTAASRRRQQEQLAYKNELHEDEEEEFEEVSPGTATTQTTSSSTARRQQQQQQDDDDNEDEDQNGPVYHHHRRANNNNEDNDHHHQPLTSPAQKLRQQQQLKNQQIANQLHGLSHGKRMNPKATDAFLKRAVQLQEGRDIATGGGETTNQQKAHPLASVTPQISKFLREAEKDGGGPQAHVVLQQEDLEDFDLQAYADKHRTLVAALEHKHAIKLQTFKRDDTAFYAEELMTLKDREDGEENDDEIDDDDGPVHHHRLQQNNNEDEDEDEELMIDNNQHNTSRSTNRSKNISPLRQQHHRGTVISSSSSTSPKQQQRTHSPISQTGGGRRSPKNNNNMMQQQQQQQQPFKNITNNIAVVADDLMPATAKKPLVRRVDPVFERQKRLAGPQLHDHLCADLLIPPMPSTVFFNDKVMNSKEPKSLVLPLPLPSTPLAF